MDPNWTHIRAVCIDPCHPTSELPVILPELEAGGMITSHMPTYRYRSVYLNLDYFRFTDRPTISVRHLPMA
jgi:hypothetical protein